MAPPPPPLPPHRPSDTLAGPPKPVPVLPLAPGEYYPAPAPPYARPEYFRPPPNPYQWLAVASWIMPLVNLGLWVLIPGDRGSGALYAPIGFLLGVAVAITALLGVRRRGSGGTASAVVGLVLNLLLLVGTAG